MRNRALRYSAVALATIALLASCGSKKRQASQELPPPPPSSPIATTPAQPSDWRAPLGDSIRQEIRGVWITTAYGLDFPKSKADTPNGVRRQQ